MPLTPVQCHLSVSPSFCLEADLTQNKLPPGRQSILTRSAE